MNETKFTKALDHVIKLELDAIDRIFAEEIAPLTNFGNPEEVIGKKYEMWQPQDFQILGQMYGNEPNALSKFIAGKEIDKMYAAEAEVESNDND
jgi:hypothetical protein